MTEMLKVTHFVIFESHSAEEQFTYERRVKYSSDQPGVKSTTSTYSHMFCLMFFLNLRDLGSNFLLMLRIL